MMDYYRTSPKKNLLFAVSQDELLFPMDPHWWIINDTKAVKDYSNSDEDDEDYYSNSEGECSDDEWNERFGPLARSKRDCTEFFFLSQQSPLK